MSRKKELVYQNGRYAGKYLDEKTCRKLETLLRISEDNGCIEDLKNCIYDLPKSSIDWVRDSKVDEFVDLPLGELTDLQTVGVAYMYFAKRLILGDSVGLGKTVEVAGLCNLIEQEYKKKGYEFRFLFLTGKTLVSEIRDKMIKFTGKYVEDLYGEKAYVEKFIDENWEELKYSVVGAHSLLKNVQFQQYVMQYESNTGSAPFDILIIDEAGDVLTNTNTQNYKSGVILSKYFDRVVLLNATPFEKELRQFYAQLSFIDDSFLPCKTEFSKEYEVMKWGRSYPVFSGEYKNADKFRNLIAYRYLARTRKLVEAVMRDCTADVFVSELSPEQKMLIKSCSMSQMVYDCPSYFNITGYNICTNIDTTPKLRDLVALLDGKLKNERSILIYTRYREAQSAIYTELNSRGYSVGVLNGSSSIKTRNNITNRFKLGDLQVLVTNVQKGLDFGDCNHCIFYDYDPNPNKMVQFEGRMTRQQDIINKHVYLLVSDGKELKTLQGIVKDRAKASDLFAGSDYSCVLSLLLNDNKLTNL